MPQLPKTFQFTVDAAHKNPIVLPVIGCTIRRVRIREQSSTPTTDYDVFAPGSSDVAHRHNVGEVCEFGGPNPGQYYQSGDTIGYVTAVQSGTVTFTGICD